MAQYPNEDNEIGALVRELETAFIHGGGVQMSQYVNSDLYTDINKIYAYLESKHISGDTDTLGREKPFFNIVTAARNIWYRATDLDRKNINVKATKSSDVVATFIATVHLQNWMRKVNFGQFLNDWGMELAAFNSCVVKFIESGDELHSMVVPWSRLIVDQVNFDSNPKIEILELTEAELYQRKNYDKEMIEKLCEALEARESTDGTDKDQKAHYICLYEVHGNLPLSYLTGKETDADKYVQQMHVISFVASKEKGEYDDFTLYSGREAEDPYMLTSLLPSADGSISLNGSVKTLFEAQWMMNDTVKRIKDQLDLTSKVIFQTADANFVGRNVLAAIETGDILIHSQNMPLTQVQNQSQDITANQAFGDMWKGLSQEIAGISEAMQGEAKSGAAWRQVEALLQESHSLFELMTENKGLHIEQMLRKFVIPHLTKKMDTSEEVAATLEAHNISKIDSIYVPQEAIKRHKKRTLDQMEKMLSKPIDAPLSPDEVPQPFNPINEEQGVRQSMAPQGNQRFFVPDEMSSMTWKEYLKDIQWELEVDITGEQSDKQTILTTLSTALTAVANPAYANNPQAQLIVNKILSATGVISPIEISTMPPSPPMPQPAPSGGAESGLQALAQPNAR
jgi:hypothetical protein